MVDRARKFHAGFGAISDSYPLKFQSVESEILKLTTSPPIGWQCGLASRGKCGHLGAMSTVAEIESAIEQLPIEQVREVAAWLEEYQAAINASSEVFAMLDAEEGEGAQWHEK